MKVTGTKHRSLRNRQKKARRTGQYFSKPNPSYRDNQNDEKGSFEHSRDGYAEKQQVKRKPALP